MLQLSYDERQCLRLRLERLLCSLPAAKRHSV
jgi:hypothetical protein